MKALVVPTNASRFTGPRKSLARRIFSLTSPAEDGLYQFGRAKDRVYNFTELLAVARECFVSVEAITVYLAEETSGNYAIYPHRYLGVDREGNYTSTKPVDKVETKFALEVATTNAPAFFYDHNARIFTSTPDDFSFQKGKIDDNGSHRILFPLVRWNGSEVETVKGILAIKGNDLRLKNSVLLKPIASMKVASNIASAVMSYINHNFDFATSLPTKRDFETDLAEAIASGRMFSLVLFDFDEFKELNKEQTYFGADHALLEISLLINQIIRSEGRKIPLDKAERRSHPVGETLDATPSIPSVTIPPDKLYRWGGDEFLILLEGVDAAVATRIAERCRAAVEAHSVNYRQKTFKVTVSMSVLDNATLIDAKLREGQTKADYAKELLARTLDLAKIRGRNIVVRVEAETGVVTITSDLPKLGQ